MVKDQLEYTTNKHHVDNLWLLGGEIIRGIYSNPELNGLNGRQLTQFVDEEGGPVSRHLATDDEQRSFIATCRKLHRFLIQGRTPSKDVYPKPWRLIFRIRLDRIGIAAVKREVDQPRLQGF